MKQSKVGSFEVLTEDGRARSGVFQTAHGEFNTPAFMPVGTQASVKGVAPKDIKKIGAEIVLVNAYHLLLRPGEELVERMGGIQKFMAWDGPVLSDSGGFQVFSLTKFSKVEDNGVTFKSHLDGTEIFLTPERVIDVQQKLGVDIMMVLDECLPHDATHSQTEKSWQRTLSWAKRSIEAKTKDDSSIFGIVQGAMYEDLREKAAKDLIELPFDGFAVGGLSVGEGFERMCQMVEAVTVHLPEEKPRYLMGVGTPKDILHAVSRGIDMFDCVIPTRSARFGRIYIENRHINIRNAQFRDDETPLEESCDCYACQNFSKAYIAHLFHAKEMLGVQLASIHNLRFYQRLMQRIRSAIEAACLQELVEEFSEEASD